MHSVLDEIGLFGVVPVIAIGDARHARHLGGALVEGGLPIAEVTFRTAAALDAIKELREAYPDMLIGAGTVLTVQQAKAAQTAGARFIVSPGLNRGVVEYCRAEGLPVTPGIVTPTEVETALGLGLTVMKFFPAEASGGLKYLKAIAAPYSSVKFIPTGGIDRSNLLQYLRFPRTLACGGSWMVKADLIAEERFPEVRALAAGAIEEMLGLELETGTVPGRPGQTPPPDPEKLSRALGVAVRAGEKTRQTETTEGDPGEQEGSIVVRTLFIERAIAYLGRKGIGVQQESRSEEGGKLAGVTLDREVGERTVRLLQK
ncbi:MAG: bifunctional 4-hydroxy-2-oxoglutarate aldolase/2-dehydro-3-deoxy-phosphogluconate aldolase [Bacteroidetes bacterium]|nr:bifunctional 4-hydroxy-2-oxoglutarate aldolase/2-dehydro-3-deoxy-phosphogluconate aldolase [Bacteroidota bacterium]